LTVSEIGDQMTARIGKETGSLMVEYTKEAGKKE
jgi:hypothetical protein